MAVAVRLGAVSGRARRLLVVLITGFLALVGVFGLRWDGGVGVVAGMHSGGSSLAALGRLPLQAQGLISTTLGATRSAFAARWRGGTYRVAGGGVAATVRSGAVRFVGGGGSFSLALTMVGHGRRVREVHLAHTAAVGNRVLVGGAGIMESLDAGPLGVEQAFVFNQRPVGARGPLSLALQSHGSLVPRVSGSGVVFVSRSGAVVLRYGGLSALDAAGRSLPARMTVRAGILELQIDDRGARYPLTVDPFTEQQKIVPTDEASATSDPGSAVAVSSDGSTVLIGAPCDGGCTGAVWVFTRSGTTWKEQTKIVPTDVGQYGGAEFGSSVAVSADGNTAVIGGPSDNTLGAYPAGAMWVYVRSGSTWSEQQKIVPSDAVATDGWGVGYAVAVSADGNTALTASAGNDAAWVYTRSGGTWTKQQELGVGGTNYSVALSGDGDTAIIGLPNDPSPGAAFVYTRSGSTWTQQKEIVPTDATPPPPPPPPVTCGGVCNSLFGWSVSLSSNGNAALIGGIHDGTTGAAWVYTRSGTSWTEQKKIVPTDEGSTSDEFGFSASMSSAGGTLLIGGTDRTGKVQGAAWAYKNSAGSWTEQKISPADAGTTTQIGFSVALSSNATTAIIGAPDDELGNAATWVYTAPQLVVTSTGDQDDTATDLSNGVCNVNLTGPQACTLRAAIEVADQIGGGTITFDIPNDGANRFDGTTGVPQIEPASTLPDLKAPITIDGKSQPGAGKVEITDTSTTGIQEPLILSPGADGSLIRGLVLNRWQIGIFDEAPATFQGNLIGTDPSGRRPMPADLSQPIHGSLAGIFVAGDGTQIGGTRPGEGNLISGNATTGIDIFGASGVVIQGNTIGPPLGGRTLLLPPHPQQIDGDHNWQTAAITDEVHNGQSGSRDTIGGRSMGEGNTIAGEVLLNAAHDVLQGNTLTDGATLVSADNVTVGGPTRSAGTAPGNTFDRAELILQTFDQTTRGPKGTVIQGNDFHGGLGQSSHVSGAIELHDATHTTIGGTGPAFGNLIDGGATTQSVPWPDGIDVYDYQVSSPGDNVIENNTIRNSEDAGVQIENGDGNHITANHMSGNGDQLGIELGDKGYLFASLSPFTPSGPNDDQPYPQLLSATENGMTNVTLRLTAPAGAGRFTVELYSQPSCAGDSITPGQGEHSLGTRSVAVSLTQTTTTLTFGHATGAVTATATSSNGSTSEFSPCVTIGQPVASYTKNGVTPTGSTIAVSTSGTQSGSLDIAAATDVAKHAHGTLRLFCPPITTRYCQGSFTLKTAGKNTSLVGKASFKLAPGQVKSFVLTITGKLLTQLKVHRHLSAVITITSHDGAKHPHHKTATRKVMLVYK